MIAVMTFNSGCFTYKSYVPIDLKEIDLNVPLAVTDISIEDNRTEISEEEDIKIPFMSGLKGKAWKHHPKLLNQHKHLIENTIYKNFNSNSTDSAKIVVTINYACKEFEQTGKSEIERVYLNTETKLITNTSQLISNAIDTFHYESMDASNKHFEKFYQTSIRNNLVRSISELRNQFYNLPTKESECFDSTYFKTKIVENISITIAGSSPIEEIEIPEKIQVSITQDWTFKMATDELGELTYIENLDQVNDKADELKELMRSLYKLKLNKQTNSNCWNMRITSTNK